MNIKYQIFISSTYEDLKEERDQVIKACLEMGHIPVGMEMFSAADEEQWQIIARQIEASDYYVVIVANKYGSITNGISYTEKEYDYAIAKGVPVLGFVLKDGAMWPSDRTESDTKIRRKLDAFKQKVKGRPVNFWATKEELHGQCAIALMKTFNTQPRPGWMSVTEIGGSEVSAEMSRLSSENAKLRAELDELKPLNDTSGLAQGDDIYTLHLALNFDYRRVDLEITWNELFIIVAKAIIIDPALNNLRYNIPSALAAKANKAYQVNHPEEVNTQWAVFFSYTEQLDEIETQFMALGLIQVKHTYGENNSIIWTLTPAGERRYALALAKKRDQ